MKPIVAPVVADSKRLLRDVVSVCADFPQRLKFILSERLVALALDSVLRAQEAARAGKRRPDLQLPLVAALIDCTDRLQALIDAAFDLKCFKSQGQYEAVIRLAETVGAQAEGWKEQIRSALPNPPNPAASVQRARLEIGRATSWESVGR